MKSPDANCRMLLQRDVEIAGECYEQAMKKVVALLDVPGWEGRPELAEALEMLGRCLNMYTDTLRSLATFAGRDQTAAGSRKHFVAHA